MSPASGEASPRASVVRRFGRYVAKEPLLFWGAFFGTVTALAFTWSISWAISVGVIGAIVTVLLSIIYAARRAATAAEALASVGDAEVARGPVDRDDAESAS